MPRGDNLPKGPYLALPTKNGEGAIGVFICPNCSGNVSVKVNKAGWLYYYCTGYVRKVRCGTQGKTQGLVAAAAMIKQIEFWYAPAKAKALALAEEHEPPEPELEPVEAPTPDEPPAPEHVKPIPEKKPKHVKPPKVELEKPAEEKIPEPETESMWDY